MAREVRAISLRAKSPDHKIAKSQHDRFGFARTERPPEGTPRVPRSSQKYKLLSEIFTGGKEFCGNKKATH
jgi:hypothetical protein